MIEPEEVSASTLKKRKQKERYIAAGSPVKVCSDCGDDYRIFGQSRCAVCQRKYKSTTTAVRRKKAASANLVEDNKALALEGKKRCSKCLRIKRLSDYRFKGVGRTGVTNKMCNRCLAVNAINTASKHDVGNYSYWKKKAYSVNATNRQRYGRISKRKGVKYAEVPFYLLTADDYVQMYLRQEGRCYYCSTVLVEDSICMDHKQPLSKEGSYGLDNLAVCCKDCNHLKHDRTEAEFTAWVHTYVARFRQQKEKVWK